MNIFGYTIDIYKTGTPESIHNKKVKDFKLNATRGLADARLQLELNQALLDQAEKNKEEEKEIKNLQESVQFQWKSIKRYLTQLDVLNKQ